MTQAAIKGMLFDADGVVYFRDEQTLMPILDFFKGKGVTLTAGEFEAAYGRRKLDAYKGRISKDEHLRETLNHLQIQYDSLFFNQFKETFRANYAAIKLGKGIRPLFARLKQEGLKIAVITDTFSSEEQKWRWFRRIGLDTFIDVIVCSSETGFTKDEMGSYAMALRKLNLKPKEVLFVGHQEYEMEGARKAGVTAVSLVKGIKEDIYVNSTDKLIHLICGKDGYV
ncbi:MAG: HAD family hydrolase [Deltaproteobacteria bacterium]|nr:HAD family hydrolase [Deltaproteobacteria bacterium]